MTKGPRAWVAFAAVLFVLAILAQCLPADAIDWQPTLAARQPWRAFSAAALHYSTLHLGANLAGTLLVAALGVAAQVPRSLAWAWFAAWPLTQIGLLLRPDLAHFGGLSGVLHAGVAIVATHLLLSATGRRRWIGAAILIVLCIKVLSESPWGPPLRHPPEWDIALAPFAHASGLVVGMLCALASHGLARLCKPRGA